MMTRIEVGSFKRHPRNSVAEIGTIFLTKKDVSARLLMENFGLAVLSSWIVGPIGVLYLHHLGWGKNPYLLSVIISLSAAAPIQLIMNEFVATISVKYKQAVSHLDLYIIFILSFISTMISIINSNYMNFRIELILLAFFTSLSIIISYEISKMFFIGVVNGLINRRSSSIIGAVPGISTLLCYAVAGILRMDIIILFGNILPAVAQALAVKMIMPDTERHHSENPTPNNYGPIPRWLLYAMLFVLFVIGILTSAIRAQVAETDSRNAAIILIGLNLLGTAIVTTSRSLYLSTKKDHVVLSMVVTSLFVMLSLVMSIFFEFTSKLFWIVTLSMAVVTILSIGRRVVSESKAELDK